MPDDGQLKTETCSLTTIKYDVFDVSCFMILILNVNTSGWLQSNWIFGHVGPRNGRDMFSKRKISCSYRESKHISSVI